MNDEQTQSSIARELWGPPDHIAHMARALWIVRREEVPPGMAFIELQRTNEFVIVSGRATLEEVRCDEVQVH